VNRARATDLLQRLHQAQGRFYAGKGEGELGQFLSPGIEWHVPGKNAIAGHYQGLDRVMAYFDRRRQLANATMRLEPGDVLVGDGDTVASLVDGYAVISGQEERWSTVGLYRLRGDRVEACWLLPLDVAAFDRIWSPAATDEEVPDA
jgi:ketosteroid isomerase-like protein